MIEKSKPFVRVVMPCYNDAASLEQLVLRAQALLSSHYSVSFLVVDDASFPGISVDLPGIEIQVLRLKSNLGHQRAIAVGLSRLSDELGDIDFVVVMDSDGEDDPSAIPSLIDFIDSVTPFVFARRRRRSEGWKFRVGYWAYLKVFRLLIGFDMRYGNFSAFKSEVLARITSNPDLWNHFSASIASSKIPFGAVDVDRSRRIDGKSSMSIPSLITHGLSAISVFQERVLLRLGMVAGFALFIIITIASIVLVSKLITHEAIIGWASTMIAILFVGALNLMSMVFILLLGALNNRARPTNNLEEVASKLLE